MIFDIFSVTRYRQFAKLKIQLSNRYFWEKLQIKSDCGNFVQLLQNGNFLTQQLTFYSCCSQKYVVQLVEPAYSQLAERNLIYCVVGRVLPDTLYVQTRKAFNVTLETPPLGWGGCHNGKTFLLISPHVLKHFVQFGAVKPCILTKTININGFMVNNAHSVNKVWKVALERQKLGWKVAI